MTFTAPLAVSPARIATLDAVRGFAVMGILAMNIVDFAMPSYAYVDPHFYGGATGANWWTWAVAFVLFDGKMRGLFTMLFGASTVLIAERAEAAGNSAAKVHYTRMAALFAIGMVHAYLIWWGDILVLYAVVGAVAFVAWRWRVRLLLFTGGLIVAWQLATGALDYAGWRMIETKVAADTATPAQRTEWQAFASRSPGEADRQRELHAYRGNVAAVSGERLKDAWFAQSRLLLGIAPDTLALMLLGMALFRLGFFSGAWLRRSYWIVVALGFCVALPLYVPLALLLERAQFSQLSLLLVNVVHPGLLRPWLSLAWAAAIVLLVRGAWMPALSARLAATGRMAFSNYLGTSVVCTALFYGYGLGWYGELQRWQCYPVVLALWVAMLAWSKPWLARFYYGPFEWLWRTLARGSPQSFRRHTRA